MKHKVAEQLAGVENGLEELFKKYGVSSYSGLMEKFSEIPEEEGLDDYFAAQNLKYMREKLRGAK